MSQLPLFISGLELGNLVVNSDLLQLSWSTISALHTRVHAYQQQPLPQVIYIIDIQSSCAVLAFATTSTQQQADLVSSETLKQANFHHFEFLCSKSNPSISFHRAAIALFASQFEDFCLLKNQLHASRTNKLIITGHSLGGSVAAIFTLFLLECIDQRSKNLPLCITFGSPLIGDKGLQRAISEFSKWNACFLHVAGSQDPVPRFFLSPTSIPQTLASTSQTGLYKPFGTFFLCSELGFTCVEDPEAVVEALGAMGFESITSQVSSEEQLINYYGRIVEQWKSRVVLKGNSQLGLPVTDSLKAGVTLQLEAIGVNVTQQHQQALNPLIIKLERLEQIRMLNKRKALNPSKKLNEVKKKMTHLEWYKKGCAKGIGYYDSYKNELSSKDMDVTKLKRFLTNYWRETVEDAERKPQKEGVYIREVWLFGGLNYRRMVEPLDIAEYYRDKGNRDYRNQGRSKHYRLLEKWQKESSPAAAGSPSTTKKKNVANGLTEDSCFWADVEEARISCELLKDANCSTRQREWDNLVEFDKYVMEQVRNYAVSPEIFLRNSSFMKWWDEFEEIIGNLHVLLHNFQLIDFMKNKRYRQYEAGDY